MVLKLTEGTVKWFDNRKGYGFIATEEEGDI
ncbi:MAG: cold shock domain-containing protein, partial [Candidatus Lokiarchaeota archaeon]|nr:cold shock domain-containing protein [Candidatus Lokiarchaeota archaeon]